MHDRRRHIRKQARPALLWTLLFFAVVHLVVGLYLHRRHPEMFDLEMSFRLRKLPERLAEAPGRPLAVMLGSSRVVLGLRPASAMEQAPGGPHDPLLFNFGLLGMGPVGQRLVLHRLVQKGIEPKWVFVEFWPPFVGQGSSFVEESTMFLRDLYWSDLPILGRFFHRGWEAAGQFLAQTLTPLVQYRETILEHYAPSLLTPPARQAAENRFARYMLYHLDDFGWVEYELKGNARDLESIRGFKPLYDNFRIDEVSDRAFHELLDECRTHNIRVALVLMPEHSLLRGWYSAMRDRLMPYLQRLSAENEVPIIDARAWQPDEHIPDYCHLSPAGARSFSERFGRQVYRPLLEGKPLAKEVLLDVGD